MHRRMPLQSDYFADVFVKARDHGVPETQAQLAHLASAREPMPPSKAHIKRLTRDRSRPFVDVVVRKPISAETLTTRNQNEHFKRMIASMGGSRTVMPDDDGTRYNAEQRGLLTYVPPAAKAEHVPLSFAEHMEHEQRKLDAERDRLQAEFDYERAKVETIWERYERSAVFVFDDIGL